MRSFLSKVAINSFILNQCVPSRFSRPFCTFQNSPSPLPPPLPVLAFRELPYNAVEIDIGTEHSLHANEFKAKLEATVESFRQNNKFAVYLNVGSSFSIKSNKLHFSLYHPFSPLVSPPLFPSFLIIGSYAVFRPDSSCRVSRTWNCCPLYCCTVMLFDGSKLTNSHYSYQ